jgi:hypothetical protein
MAGPTIRGLGAVQPHVRTVAEEIATRFSIYNIGGFATSGHVTNSDHYKGLALDLMTGANPNAGKGNMIAEWTLANAQRLSVKYIIWNRRIHKLDNKGWTKYSGSSPHTDHVHISFHATPGSGGSSTASNGASAESELQGCMGWLLSLLRG